MFSKTFKLAKYPDEAKLNGATVTWDNPTSLKECLESGRYADEAALVASAVAYTDVQIGHAIRREFDKAVKDGKPFGVADAQAIASAFVQGAPRKRTGVGRKPKLEGRVNVEKFQQASRAKLDILLEMGSVTQEEYDAELARRAEAKVAAK